MHRAKKGGGQRSEPARGHRRVGSNEGSVYLDEGGRSSPASGIRVRLLGSREQIVDKIRTSADGIYRFEEIAAGGYRGCRFPAAMLGVARWS